MNPTPQDYASWSNLDLIRRVTDLEARLREQNARHAISPTPTSFKKKPKKEPKSFDPSRYHTRFIALKFAYLGGKYNGFEHHTNNTTPLPTIEEELWKALRKTKLIFPDFKEDQNQNEVCWDGVEYSKCGRTDRGVSAFGQVVGLKVRSSQPKAKVVTSEEQNDGDREVNGAANKQDAEDVDTTEEPVETQHEKPAWDSIQDELPYIQLLNRVLPPDIKILAWCANPPPDFSARFSCKERRYRYFFTNPAFTPTPGLPTNTKGDAWLDIEAMRGAAKKLEGLHDFRNMCKVDPSKQLTTFERRIFSARIEAVTADQEPGAFLARPPFAADSEQHPASSAEPELFYFEVCGSAFLWHQVRHMVAVLFLVGQGYEDPSIVDMLLDPSKMPGRPVYEMASDGPLVLWDCIFPDSDSIARDNHDGALSPSGYEDALEWIYVGDDVGGRDTAKRPEVGIADGKFGRNGIMDDLWAQWRKRKMDEVLAGSLMDIVARQPVHSVRLANGGGQSRSVDSARVFDGSECPRAVGRYTPVAKREQLETPEVVNARYAKRKGLAAVTDTDDHGD